MTLSRRHFLVGSSAIIASTSLAAGTALPAPKAGRAWQLPEKKPFRTVENEWIVLTDGTRLAARMWLPVSAEAAPVPVVWEYLPYRKRDFERERDTGWAEAFVPYGFAFVRVDIRGSGDSDGVLLGEYLQQEQDDAVEVIAWLARQPWSNGAVGMRGISWGGFSSLQAAAIAPPALKAILPQCASDNRYTDDAHYVGGALTLDNYDWGAEFKTVLVGPPDPAIVGARWREMWLERLKATPPILAEWLSHQRYDGFWQHGSVAVDYSRIKCPVYVVDGQIDSYRDFLPRLLEHLQVPRKGLMGPWGHKYPQLADAGPGLEWVTEEVRWWSQWLLGADTGIMDEPVLRAFIEDRTASEVWPADIPGRWVTESAWPSPHIAPRVLFLNPDGLADAPGAETARACRSQETIGLTKREWFPWNLNIDLPPDQSADDKRSLAFDSAPLTEDVEILGRPLAVIRVSSSERVAKLVVRINEVTPEGKSWSVSYGVLNLCHRDGHEAPTALEPGRRYDVEVPCYFTGHRFKKGSRIRVAITESIWPMLWPSPRPVTLQITTGASRLSLPVRPKNTESQRMPITLLKDRIRTKIEANPGELKNNTITTAGPDADGRVMLHKRLRDPAETLADIGTTMSGGSDWYLSIKEGDPNSSKWKLEWFSRLTRGEWDTTLRSTMELTSTAEEFRIKESIHALEADKTVFERQWDHRIKRDLM
ncbi:MAG TPA: CocE/NonD family hydrolase [Steroidobacteraceae bacterium]|jgi:putative CocE/NonD family hydrolase|nr:CocE/NonD family hydrolase [Steroidobacteraceae bacterium]